ncbi:MAG: chorismate--pyruvate lyase family protein [Gammaproteobacteria bacterium]
MTIHSKYQDQSREWLPGKTIALPENQYVILNHSASLTKYLSAHTGTHCDVKVLNEFWEIPMPDEALNLGLSDQTSAWIREVKLMCDDKIYVYARSVFSQALLENQKKRFDGLKNQSLGELLFIDPAISRGDIEVTRVSSGDYFYDQAVKLLSSPPDQLWARRSNFFIEGHPLLVCEVFLDYV